MKQIIRSMAVAALTVGIVALSSCKMTGPVPGPDLSLAVDGKTEYQVVKPDNSSTVDDYAVRALTNNLQQITGAKFPVVKPGEMAADKPSIFVGLGAPALKRLGRKPLSGLAEEEHVARSMGRDIFLYGQGARGNLYAVMDFLENSLGWRWFSVFSNPVTPSRPTVTLSPFNRKRGFSFVYREIIPYFNDHYYYQQGANMAYSWVTTNPNWKRYVSEGIVPAFEGMDRIGGCHSLHQYIPPSTNTHIWPQYQWVGKRDYFTTNPEFFSMNAAGVRVPGQQLCFGNPALRDELTRNVLEHIRRLGEHAILTVGAEDSGGSFCYCPDCKKLESKYASPAGAYFDYLLELSVALKTNHPSVRIKGLAYRREQTQKPPTLPGGTRFPDNFIILFAPIADPYLGDWSQPDPGLQETYRDLLGWSKIVSTIWVFYYPNPYGTGMVMPLGNVERLITAMRLMHKAGVRGMYMEHASGVVEGGNFTELLAYLFLKLTQDINCDTDAAIREFTDHQYGPAAELVRTYLAELEQGRKNMKVMPRGVTYDSPVFSEEIWPYLTPDNILRWQGYFDKMELQTAAQPTELANIQRLRRNLDFGTLFKWLELAKKYPDYFKDYTVHSRRIEAVNKAKRADLACQPRPMGEKTVPLFESIIRGGGEKPLPAEFNGIDRLRIRTFMPVMKANDKYAQGFFDDSEAAFGYAPSVHKPDMPFTFGFYQGDTRTDVLRRVIEKDEITPGKYRLYKLGAITLSPKSQIWFSVLSWSTRVELDDLWKPGDPNIWEAYASIKFQGPVYGGSPVKGLRSGEENLVLVDRVILVKQKTDGGNIK